MRILSTEIFKVYESSGRMFLLSDIKTVRAGLDKKSEGYKEKIHILNGNKDYLEKQIKEQENNLRELITTKKNASWIVLCKFMSK